MIEMVNDFCYTKHANNEISFQPKLKSDARGAKRRIEYLVVFFLTHRCIGPQRNVGVGVHLAIHAIYMQAYS